ncbi:MAG: O-antigen ligase family protein [Gammaproteobacteria bacterium]|nr:O-antigen ligase family protein [Gammaproteobacteria bacterium]
MDNDKIKTEPASFQNNILIFLVTGFVFLHPLIYIHGLRDPSSLTRYAFLGLFSCFILVVFFMSTMTKQRKISWHPILFLLLLIILWMSFSLSWSEDKSNGFLELTQYVSLAIFCFVITQITSWKNINYFIIASLAGGAITALIGIQQNFGYNPFGYMQLIPPSASFTNKNFVSLYLDLIVYIGLIVFLFSKKRPQIWLSSTALYLLVSYQMISHTRGSWLSLSAAGAILVFLYLKNNTVHKNLKTAIYKKIVILTFIITSSLITANLPSNVFEKGLELSRTEISSEGFYNSVRIIIYANTLDLISDNWLIGTGLGSYQNAFRPYMFSTLPLSNANEDNYVVRAHSEPLHFFTELGVPGGTLIIIFYLYLLVLSWDLIIRSTSNHNFLISLGLFLSLLTTGIHAFLDFPLHKPSSAIQFFTWAGLIIGLSSSKGLPITRGLQTSISVIFILSGLAFLLFNLSFYNKAIHASREMQIALSYYSKQDCQNAVKHLDKSVRISSFDYRWQQYMAIIYTRCKYINPTKKYLAMNQVIEAAPYNTRARLTRGYIWLNSNKPEMAEKDFQLVTKILPHRASGYIGLGQLALKQGNAAKARNYFKQALLVQPESSEAQKLINQLDKP